MLVDPRRPIDWRRYARQVARRMARQVGRAAVPSVGGMGSAKAAASAARFAKDLAHELQKESKRKRKRKRSSQKKSSKVSRAMYRGIGSKRMLRPRKTLRKKINELEKFVENQTSVKICRDYNCERVLSSVNEQAVDHQAFPNVSHFETCVSSLLFFNPATPGTLTSVDLDAGTYPQNIKLRHETSILCRNNYQTDVRVIIYRCNVKVDTAISADTAWSNGLTDNPSGALATTAIGVTPYDSNQIRQLYRTKIVADKYLKPGQSVSAVWGSKKFNFDPALQDSHGGAYYQKKLFAGGFLVVVHGTPGHDTISAEEGILAAGVDIFRSRKIWVYYDSGGVDLRDIDHGTAGLQSFTNAGVQSSHPVADNIGYSVN